MNWTDWQTFSEWELPNICFVINPERIILGGGIMEQEAYMKPRIEAALEKYLVSQIWKHTTVCMAAYQNNAGMLGALYHLQAELSR
ncbi:MAG: ROK family protein [Lachnospiraceae bacterium]